MSNNWENHSVWAEWGKLTAYYNALDVACDWYSAIWSLVPIEGIDDTTVVKVRGISEFKKRTGDFRALLNSRNPLAQMVFLSSYALFEDYCNDAFEALATAGNIQSQDDYLVGGIECWSEKLLHAAGRDWTAVQCGRSGILEVGLIRNALVHGSAAYSAKDVERFTTRGLTATISVGQRIPSSAVEVFELRHRLNYYLTILQQGLCKTVP
jgi:hypothetical protein